MLKRIRQKLLWGVAAVALAGTLGAVGLSTISAAPASAHNVGYDNTGNWRSQSVGYYGTMYRVAGDNMPWCSGYHRDLITNQAWRVNYVSDWHKGWYRPTYNFWTGFTCNYGW